MGLVVREHRQPAKHPAEAPLEQRRARYAHQSPQLRAVPPRRRPRRRRHHRRIGADAIGSRILPVALSHLEPFHCALTITRTRTTTNSMTVRSGQRSPERSSPFKLSTLTVSGSRLISSHTPRAAARRVLHRPRESGPSQTPPRRSRETRPPRRRPSARPHAPGA